VLAGDASPATLVSLRGSDVRARFQEVVNGIMGAIDFLRTNLQVQSLVNLPFSTLLVPLTVFFAAPGGQHIQLTGAQRQRLLRWFWRSCFSRRFSSGVLRNLKDDISAVTLLKDDRPNMLGDFPVLVNGDFFTQNAFRVNTVNSTTFVLMLAQRRPLSFVSGQPVALDSVLRDYNRSEFHHLFPRAFLTLRGVAPAQQAPLVNFAFISKADNVVLGGDSPSAYRARMPGQIDTILNAALCPPSLFADDYSNFIRDRARLLEEFANQLIH
jgi:hypothetical protein